MSRSGCAVDALEQLEFPDDRDGGENLRRALTNTAYIPTNALQLIYVIAHHAEIESRMIISQSST